VANLVALGVIVAIFAVLFWLGMRWTRRPSAPTDLRRADDAESAAMPSAAEVQERIGEAFGQTLPPGR
jgi:hypothetical protein